MWKKEIKDLMGVASIENKRAFLYGVGMHIISDSFAHSTFAWVDGKWKSLNHSNDYADNMAYGTNRWYLSYNTVYNVWARLCNGSGNYELYRDYYYENNDYLYVADKKKGGSFKMYRIYNYALECNASYTNAINAFLRINKASK